MACTRQPGLTQWCTEAAEAHKRIAELESALAYYADPDLYLSRSMAALPPAIHEDAGALARAAVPHWEDVAPLSSLSGKVEQESVGK